MNNQSKTYNIGVISESLFDFNQWRKKNNLSHEGGELNHIFKFTKNNKQYFCINNVRSLCSKSFDQIIETENAIFNNDYKEIKLESRINLKENFHKNLIGSDQPWDLLSVLKKLVKASDILLHEKDYDRDGWEEHEFCYKRGLEIIELLGNEINKNGI